MSAEETIGRAIMNELGAYNGWLSMGADKTYREIPKRSIIFASNLKSYRYTKVGDIIRIDLTPILKKKAVRKAKTPVQELNTAFAESKKKIRM